MDKFTINNLVFKCMVSDHLADRMRYGAEARRKIKQLEQTLDELIEQLTKAGQTIVEQNELLKCCYKVLGEERSHDIIDTWKTLKELKLDKLYRED